TIIAVSDYFVPGGFLGLVTAATPEQCFEACAEGNLKLLQSMGTNLNPKNKNRFNETHLLVAVDYRQRGCCEFLIQSGHDINATDYWGKNALHLAAAAGDIEIARLFVSHNKL